MSAGGLFLLSSCWVNVMYKSVQKRAFSIKYFDNSLPTFTMPFFVPSHTVVSEDFGTGCTLFTAVRRRSLKPLLVCLSSGFAGQFAASMS